MRIQINTCPFQAYDLPLWGLSAMRSFSSRACLTFSLTPSLLTPLQSAWLSCFDTSMLLGSCHRGIGIHGVLVSP